jgi:hypothetical protein
MNRDLERYALDLAEDYFAFLLDHEEHEMAMRPEAYAKARINNAMSSIISAMMENLKEMGVE